MSETALASGFAAGKVAEHRAELDQIRERGRRLFDGGATGVQVAAAICEATDAFVVRLFEQSLATLDDTQRAMLEQNTAVIAVGGTGRGELAPYSDYDILFLYRGSAGRLFSECVSHAVRNYWDAGIKLGHSIRTPGESIRMARQEPQVATALVEARLLWGDADFFGRFQRAIRQRVVDSRLPAFLNDCIAAREAERVENGSTVRKLEPDVKCSLGGLRDVHLIRWLAFGSHKTADIDSLRLKGGLSKEEARRLIAAHDFLMRIRIDLHFAAGKPHDILTRDEQLRITKERNIEDKPGQRAVESFMQTYFRHSTAIAEISNRFIELQRPRSLGSRLVGMLTSHRADGIYTITGDHVDVLSSHRQSVLTSLDRVVQLFQTAAMNGVTPHPKLLTDISPTALDEELSPDSAARFLDILSRSGHVGTMLRSLYQAGLLERIVPDMAHARCLLQFNQYHSFTVDEHTLRAVEAAEQLEQDDGPLGTAYRAIRHKEVLHLAVLLHDLGKGFDGDHSDVGKQIAERIGPRLGLSEKHCETLVFLVHKHLRMSHMAFRRDIADPQNLIELSYEVGSPETLRMLYVLSAADLMAVGPGAWTDWKADLLTELYDNVMLILSGKHLQFHEHERMQRIKNHVRRARVPLPGDDAEADDWLCGQLDSFPAHYLVATPPDRIAADLDIVGQRKPGDLNISGQHDAETDTFEYRVITDDKVAAGCFHKMAGVLTAKHLEILSAQVSTSSDGVVIDSYRVIDAGAAGAREARIDEVSRSIRGVLQGESDVEQMFQRHRRFESSVSTASISDLPTRVALDNSSSDRRSIIDVFAHDRTGLLYTLSRAIYDLGLSVLLAKISTHFDQVVDVFYVTEADGRKIEDPHRLRDIQSALTETLEEFERQGYKRFLS